MEMVKFPSILAMPDGDEIPVNVTADVWRERTETPSHYVYYTTYAKVSSVVDGGDGEPIVPDNDSLHRLEEEALDYA